jgi:exodeoxyribonuclease V gamma subunit
VLHIHRADRADHLVGALAGVLSEPLADPFAAEVVAVSTRGVERWVAQQLSGALGVGERSDGVCANVLFPSPRQLVDEVVWVASGFEADRDPWLPQRLVWPLLESVDAHLAEAWLAKLRAHLDLARGGRSRRLRVVTHLATLYDRYAIYRPELLKGWLASDDDDRWQAQLWRRLRARVASAGPAERLEAACRELRADPDLTELPGRVSLFGLTSLPVRHLEVLRALAEVVATSTSSCFSRRRRRGRRGPYPARGSRRAGTALGAGMCNRLRPGDLLDTKRKLPRAPKPSVHNAARARVRQARERAKRRSGAATDQGLLA